IEGAVAMPGLYTLPADSRVGDAIQAAGGLAADARPGAANLAQKLADGEQVVIPSQADAEQAAQDTSSSAKKGGKININTASATELQKLSGVGPALSERIVEYRESKGHFSSIEDLQNVSGIGETRFANLRDKICV
ncbi:MAG: helix-hairpin-helix domain-containing protein, partial [Bacteroidales bacterium]